MFILEYDNLKKKNVLKSNYKHKNCGTTEPSALSMPSSSRILVSVSILENRVFDF